MRLTGSRTYYRPAPPKMPPGLVELMEGLTKEVLKHNPEDIYGFCAGHVQLLLEKRDGPSRMKSLSLEEKITRAQEKVRQRAEKRIQDYDKKNCLLKLNNDTELEDPQPTTVHTTRPNSANTAFDKSNVKLKDADKNAPIVQNTPVNLDHAIGGSCEMEIAHEADMPEENLIENNGIRDIIMKTNDGLKEDAIESDLPENSKNVDIDESIIKIKKEENIINNHSETVCELVDDSENNKSLKNTFDNSPTVAAESEKSTENLDGLNTENVSIETNVQISNPVDANASNRNSNLASGENNLLEEVKGEEIAVNSSTYKIRETNDMEDIKLEEVPLQLSNIQESDDIHRKSPAEISSNNNNMSVNSAEVSKPLTEIGDPQANPETNCISPINIVGSTSSKSDSSGTQLDNIVCEPDGSISTPNTKYDENIQFVDQSKLIAHEKEIDSSNSNEIDKYQPEEHHTDSEGWKQSIKHNISETVNSNLSVTNDESENRKLISDDSDYALNALELNSDTNTNSLERVKQDNSETPTLDVANLHVDTQDNINDNCMDGINSNITLKSTDTGNSGNGETATSVLDESTLNGHDPSRMDIETAAVTIQKVFRNFLFKSRSSTLEDSTNDDEVNFFVEDDKNKEECDLPIASALNIDRRVHGITRMDTVLQTVNEEKSLSLSEDSSTLSSAATIIQAHVRGFLVRNKLNSNKTLSTNSLAASNSNDPSITSLEADNDQNKNKTILNIHIVPEGENYLSRDESLITSMDLSLDSSPPSSINLHPLGYDKSERRKQLKREDAIQSISPPSNNSGKLSEDFDSVKELSLSDVDIVAEHQLEEDPIPTNDGLCEQNGRDSPKEKVSHDTVAKINQEVIKIENGTIDDSTDYLRQKRKSLTKTNSDEMDVVTPFISNEESGNSKVMHSGEFHDAVLPTRVSRSDTSVVSGE